MNVKIIRKTCAAPDGVNIVYSAAGTGFQSAIMKHMGHYPMIECPDEFNRHMAAVVEALIAKN